MDSSYDRNNLSALPTGSQRIVNAACHSKGASIVDLKRFQTLYTNTKTGKDIRALRPAFWILLDPARIPVADDLDAPSAQTKNTVLAGHIGLGGIYRDQSFALTTLREHAPAYASIWPRVWAWVEFLHRCSALVLPGVVESELVWDFIGFSSRGLRSPDARKAAWDSPQFLPFVFRAWDHLLALPLEEQEKRYQWIDSLIPSRLTVAYCDEIVAGVGGTLEDLAWVLHKQLHYALSHLGSPDKNPRHHHFCVLNLAGVIDLITGFDSAISESRDPPPDPLAPKPRMVLTAAMVERGVARLLSKTFCVLAETKPDKDTDSLFDGLLVRLLDALTLIMVDSLVGFRILLKNDFIPGIFAYCRRRKPAQEKGELQVILTRALPQLSFFHSNVLVFQDAINTVDANAPQSTFRDKATYDAWVRFREMLKWHLFLLHEFTLRGLLREKAACDSIVCGKITFKDKLRTCAGCKTRNYCSNACQREDWTAGKHKETCRLARRVRLAFRSDLSAKDMHYFRFVLHKLATKDAITLEHWAARISYEERTPTPVLQFIFGGREESRIEMNPCVTGPEQARKACHPSRLDPLWDDWVERAKRSHGRMELHALHLAAGFHDRLLIIPRRSNMSWMYDTCARLFLTVPGVKYAGQEGVWEFERAYNKLQVPRTLEAIH
ncbi:MYND-type domain-containing protein [Mycena indigotica]|uniref:MYND-type domain-containing protein n=1 Tax=Mycena indigotica TaxID=2126181 RepID=A0A8H6S0R1_9AGAR|nr:MYND-type domain-containing protein [Mycena indigotica]KAF7289767.1 MYND-type domain-containing protein [Mycena indigotica]